MTGSRLAVLSTGLLLSTPLAAAGDSRPVPIARAIDGATWAATTGQNGFTWTIDGARRSGVPPAGHQAVDIAPLPACDGALVMAYDIDARHTVALLHTDGPPQVIWEREGAAPGDVLLAAGQEHLWLVDPSSASVFEVSCSGARFAVRLSPPERVCTKSMRRFACPRPTNEQESTSRGRRRRSSDVPAKASAVPYHHYGAEHDGVIEWGSESTGEFVVHRAFLETGHYRVERPLNIHPSALGNPVAVYWRDGWATTLDDNPYLYCANTTTTFQGTLAYGALVAGDRMYGTLGRSLFEARPMLHGWCVARAWEAPAFRTVEARSPCLLWAGADEAGTVHALARRGEGELIHLVEGRDALGGADASAEFELRPTQTDGPYSLPVCDELDEP